MNLRRTVRGPITWLIVAVILVLALLTITGSSGGYKAVSLSTIENAIRDGQVASATVQDKEQQIQVTLKSGTQIQKTDKLQSAYTLHYDDTLLAELQKAGVRTYKVKVSHENPFLSVIFNLIPF